MNDSLPPLPAYEPVQPSEAFAEGVLNRVHRHRTIRRIRHGSLTLLLLAAVTGVGLRNQWPLPTPLNGPDPVAHARQGVDWLVETQSGDGRWQAEKWGGHASFTPGVTALATLALLHAPDPAPAASMESALQVVQQHLQEAPLTRMHGPEFYNYLLSMNTLLEAESLAPDADRRRLLRSNLAQLIRRQQPNGGWGYAEDQPLSYTALREDNSNSAITWWVCTLLEKGRGLEVEGVTSALDRGTDWLSKRFQSEEQIAYQANSNATATQEDALFWMAARMISVSNTSDTADLSRDAYRDVLRVGALRAPSPPEDVLKMASMERGQQQDRWWKAGGKVYVTAANVICLVPRGGV